MVPRFRIRRLSALLPMLWLVACASPGQLPSDPHLEESDWVVQGRLALSNGRDGGSGELTWHQGDGWARLEFVGALGRGSWRLDVAPDSARLQLATGELYQAGAVDELVRLEFGWDFPVSQLRHWVQGQPAPGAEYRTQRDLEGRLTLLQQSGWQIEFEGYGRSGPSHLPRKITATRGSDRVRLLIRQWQGGAVEHAPTAGLTPALQ